MKHRFVTFLVLSAVCSRHSMRRHSASPERSAWHLSSKTIWCFSRRAMFPSGAAGRRGHRLSSGRLGENRRIARSTRRQVDGETPDTPRRRALHTRDQARQHRDDGHQCIDRRSVALLGPVEYGNASDGVAAARHGAVRCGGDQRRGVPEHPAVHCAPDFFRRPRVHGQRFLGGVLTCHCPGFQCNGLLLRQRTSQGSSVCPSV